MHEFISRAFFMPSIIDLSINFVIHYRKSKVPLIKPVGMPLADFKQYGLKDFDSGLFGFCHISLIFLIAYFIVIFVQI